MSGGLWIVSLFAPDIIALYQLQVPTLPGALAVGATIALIGALALPNSGAAKAAHRSYGDLASELTQIAGKSEVVINAINDGVIALDGTNTIQLINPAAQQMLGWTRQDALNLSYKSILKILDTKNQPIEEINDPIAQAQLKNEITKSDAFSLETHSGKSFLAHISVSPVGQPGAGVIVVFRDITAEKSDERQRAEFISTASHEMRTPVASIEGYLGLALNPATATIDEKAREYINKAHDSAQHLGNLFADLLDVSKADDHRLKNDPRVVDVVPFVQNIVEGLTHKATEKGLRILYKPIPSSTSGDEGRRLNPVFYANVDNDHLREITDNLVENAIKYTPQGDVTVDVTGSSEKVVISITDTGIGIPREDQSHLFQKFYRVDNSDTREIGGTGLGLYLCRRLAENMGGRIWVESEYKKGSTFFVEIPRIGQEEATRLIEQASIEAERRAAAEHAQAERDAAAVQREAAILETAPQAPLAEPAAPEVIQPVPQAEPVTPIATVEVAPPTPAPVADNTPLSVIEASPGQYTRQAPPAISVPPRQ